MGTTFRFLLALLMISATWMHARAAAPRYAVTQLQQLSVSGSIYSSGISIDDEGIAVGGATFNYSSTPLKWTADNQLVQLQLPTVETSGLALNVAENGVIVGHIWNSSMPVGTQPALFDSNSTQLLLGPNSHATVYGVSGNGSALIDRQGVLSLVDVAGSATVLNTAGISLLTGSDLHNEPNGLVAINRDGDVAASARMQINGTTRIRPFKITDTGVPEILYSEEVNGTVSDLNHLSVAVGNVFNSADPSTSSTLPAVFNDGLVVRPSMPGLNSGTLIAVNDRSQFVGNARVSGRITAVVGEGNTLRSLGDLLPATAGWTLMEVTDINNRGQIIGFGYFDHDENPNTARKPSGFRLDPIRSPGDTNYDNVVNFTDLLTLAQHYGQSGNGNVFWETGDFNFDWAVNFDDLLTLSQNYSAAGQFEADWQLARSLVPEPVCVSILSLAICMRGRRRN